LNENGIGIAAAADPVVPATETPRTENAAIAAARAELASFEPDFDAVIEALAPSAQQGDPVAMNYVIEALFRGSVTDPAIAAQMQTLVPQFAEMGHPMALLREVIDLAGSEAPLTETTRDAIYARMQKIHATNLPRNQRALEDISRQILLTDPAEWDRPLGWYLERADDPYAQYELFRYYRGLDAASEMATAQARFAAICWLSQALITQERMPFLGQPNWQNQTVNNEPRMMAEMDADIFLACRAPDGMDAADMIDRAIAIENGTIANLNPFPNRDVAVSWIRLAALGGDAAAQTRYALYLHERDRFLHALDWSGIAAEEGDAEAQFYHAIWTLHYADISFNEPQPDLIGEAVAWLNLSASQGFGLAQRAISRGYGAGDILPENETLAALWAERADATGAPSGDAYDAFLKANNWGLNPR